jgi:hypothetical protein
VLVAFLPCLGSRFSGNARVQILTVLKGLRRQLTRTGDIQDGTEKFTESERSKARSLCYLAIIRLGDLSRYRESGYANGLSGSKEPDWRHATGYYDLAITLCPQFGLAWHQQAVIAQADATHLRATYFLYRALSTARPDFAVKPRYGFDQNLELTFKKIIKSWERGDPINTRDSPESKGARSSLKAWFVRLAAKYYQGEAFARRDELENEVMSQLATEIKQRSFESDLQRIVLIAMAAEHVASKRIENGDRKESTMGSYVYFLSLNAKLLATLLTVFQPDLERIADEDSRLTSEGPKTLPDKITPITRRILPVIRLYSIWLLRKCQVIEALPTLAPKVDVAGLWQAYANVLTLLVRVFPIKSLPAVNYMLEEEVDTIGFCPLDNQEEKSGVYSSNGQPRPKFSDDVERLHPNEEMLVRVLSIIKAGVLLKTSNVRTLVLPRRHPI